MSDRDIFEALRDVARLPDTMLWAELGVKVPQARVIVERVDMVADRLDAVTKERDDARAYVEELREALRATGEERDRLAAARDRLRRDLDELAERLPCGWCAGFGMAPEERFGRDLDGAPVVDGPQPCPQGCAPPDWLVCERDLATEERMAKQRAEAELISARTELGHLRENEMIRARVIREKNARLRQIEHLLGIDAIVPHADPAEALRELLAELDRLRAAQSWVVARKGGRGCELCEGDIRRGEAYEEQPGTGGLRVHIHCPNPITEEQP